MIEPDKVPLFLANRVVPFSVPSVPGRIAFSTADLSNMTIDPLWLISTERTIGPLRLISTERIEEPVWIRGIRNEPLPFLKRASGQNPAMGRDAGGCQHECLDSESVAVREVAMTSKRTGLVLPPQVKRGKKTTRSFRCRQARSLLATDATAFAIPFSWRLIPRAWTIKIRRTSSLQDY